MARNTRILVISSALLILCSIAGLCLGLSSISAGEMLMAVLSGDTLSVPWRVFMHVRVPRTLAAIIAGSALSGAGLVLQSVLRNPLASPGVIGVNSGAGLCALIASAFFPGMAGLVSSAAFAGACLAVFSVYLLARLTGASRTTIVLSGVAVNSLLGACMDAVVTLVPDAALGRSAFAIGGFSAVTLQQIIFAVPFWAAGMLIPLFLHRELEIMTLGDDVAHSVGLRPERIRLLFLVSTALLAGAAVSFAGLIGFVGLIVPHIVRQILKKDDHLRIPITLVTGSILCLICDVLSRIIFAPYELPVGIPLAFLGAPFFMYLLLKRKRSNRHDSV